MLLCHLQWVLPKGLVRVRQTTTMVVEEEVMLRPSQVRKPWMAARFQEQRPLLAGQYSRLCTQLRTGQSSLTSISNTSNACRVLHKTASLVLTQLLLLLQPVVVAVRRC